jgi:RecA/RadA recombinase
MSEHDILAESALPEQVIHVERDRLRLYSVSELFDLPAPDWLIEGAIGIGALAGLYGPSGEGKSFLALDWALSVATGRPWMERAVRCGAVVYVAAEGGRSIGKRVEAWMNAHDVTDVPRAFFLLEGVQVRNPEELQALVERIQELEIQPNLVVLDTLARCFVGGEENSAKEMGEFVDGLQRLQQRTGAAVLVLHHTGKQGNEIERGSTALRAAADVMVRVVKSKDGVLTVTNNKQKDDEEFGAVMLRLHRVTVGSCSNQQTTSCVLVPTGATIGAPIVVPAHLRPSLEALAQCPERVATTSEWAIRAGQKERTLHSHRKRLVAEGYVEGAGHGRYSLTEKGRSALEGAATATHLHVALDTGMPSGTAATATTPEGVAVAAVAHQNVG